MANELTITSATFKNPVLNTLTATANAALTHFGETKNKVYLALATTFAEVEAQQAYKDDGFDSTVDYIMQTFGAGKANAYAYVQVGRAMKNGTIPLLDANGKEFSFTQLRSFVACKDTKALKEAVASGALDSDTTAKECDDFVRSTKTARTPTAPKKYRFCFIARNSETEEAEVIEMGTHTLDDFRTNSNRLDEMGFTCYNEFNVEGLHHFLYVDGAGIPVALVKAYDIPKPDKKAKK